MASALGLPDNVRETASVIYRRALDEDLLPGRSIEGVSTSSLYAAARQAGTPRSLDEIAAVPASRRTRSPGRTATSFASSNWRSSPQTPRATSPVRLRSGPLRRGRASGPKPAQHGKGTGLHSGKSPVGLAAAAVYAASLLVNEKVTQSEVSDVANISEVTIRNRYHELLEAEDGATLN